jgi:predicted P-loop ATPase
MATTSVSIYKNIHDSKSRETIHLETFLQAIQSGKWQDQVLEIRLLKEHEERQQAKKKLPYVTISGIFNDGRSVAGLSAHSGFLGMDIDDLKNDVEGTRQLLSADPYVYACFTSVSGTGLCVIFKIDPEKHREAFDGVADYLIKQYQLIIDPSGKDVSRPRYVSFDPALYHNDKAATFKKYLPKPKAKKIQATIFVQDEFERVIGEMANANVSCVEDYRDWRDIGFGLADQFGEAGRSYFHSLSSASSKYQPEMCDRQYTHCLRGNGKSGSKITIATIYWYAKQAGIQTVGDKTKKIAAATSTMKRSGLDAAAIAENLKKFEGIEGVEDIIQQAFAANKSFTQGETIVENIRMWLRHNYQLRRNLITLKVENAGNVLDEIDLNTMFLDCKVLFDDVTFDLFCKVIFSANTESYNPFFEFFSANSDQQADGVIDAFFGCFETPDDIKYFGKKWVVACIASIYGKHNPLMLIFAGEKQGTGKTEAFRRILPKELQSYYGEISTGMKDTDLNIMLTQKLIVVDDECGNKSRKDAQHLKATLSKQTFTVRLPYGKVNIDLARLASLGGTSNELGLLNDPTGNRRIVPIEVFGINHASLNAVSKIALWMEAYRLYHSGFEFELTSSDISKLAGETEKFEETTLENEMIQKFFEPHPDYFLTASEVKNKLETLTVQKFSLKRIGMELKRCGFVRVKRVGVYVYLIAEKDRLTGSFKQNDSGVTF